MIVMTLRARFGGKKFKVYTMKPVLTTTPEQRPPVNNGQPETVTLSLKPLIFFIQPSA
jgi:hypothetical protein